MPQEPWKRASQLKRAVPRDLRIAPAPPPFEPRRKPWWLLWLLLIPVGLAAWFYSGSLQAAWFRLTKQVPKSNTSYTPPPANEHKPAPAKTAIAVDDLDSGLGIGLTLYEDYHTLLDNTKDRNIAWKFTAAGNSLRLSAPGVIVYADGSLITSYTLDVPAIFTSDEWNWWQRDLRRAGLTPELTGVQAGADAADSRLSLFSDKQLRTADGWASPAYELDFPHGKLTQLLAGIKPGPSDNLQSPPAQH